MSFTVSSDLDELDGINWDFPKVDTSYLTHSLHPYPAKFIPQIPRSLIQALSHEGEIVADIFSGSGTTLVESLLLNRHTVGLDANPIACLISEAKTTRFQPGDVELLLALVKRAQNLSVEIALSTGLPLLNDNQFKSTASRPNHDAINFWFEEFVVEELAECLSWCHTLPTETSRRVALVAFSSIVVAVSKQDSDTRYVRRQKKISPGDPLKRFARALSETIKSVDSFTSLVNSELRCSVHHASVLDKPDFGDVDLIVCSPPYPNAYSYHLYHMTRMVWLEMDQPKFKREEIGSHRKYSNKGPKGATIETFCCEMAIIFELLNTCLRRGKYACFIVGNSIITKCSI